MRATARILTKVVQWVKWRAEFLVQNTTRYVNLVLKVLVHQEAEDV